MKRLKQEWQWLDPEKTCFGMLERDSHESQVFFSCDGRTGIEIQTIFENDKNSG